VPSEPLRISCPQCHASLKIVVASPGEPQTCPQCQATFLPPASSAAAPSPVDPNAEWDDLFGPSTSSAPSPGTSQAAQTPSSPTAPPSPPPPRPHPKTPGSSAPRTTAASLPSATKADAVPQPPTVSAWSRSSSVDDTPLPFDDVSDDPPSATEAQVVTRNESQDQVEGPKASDDAEADDDFRLAPAVVPPKYQVADLADRFTFGVPCRICGTLIDCLSTQVGQTIRCPDCHSSIPVPPPRDAQTRTPVSQNSLATGEVKELAPAPLPPSDPSRDQHDVVRMQAAAMLAKAKAEQEELDQRDGEVYDDSKAADIVRFLLDPLAIARLVAIAVLGVVALTLIRWSVPLFASDSSNAGSSFMLLLILIAAVPVTAAWLITAAAHAMALVRDTASSQAKIGWPDANFFDWLGQGIYVILAAVYSGLPGAALAATMISAGVNWIYALLMLMFSWVALFPLTFISMSHEASLASLVSIPVYRSTRELRGPWVLFYQASLLLGLITWGMLTMALSDSVLAALFVMCGTTLLGAFYFRLLGWLAGQLGPVLTPDDDEEPVQTTTEPAKDSDRPPVRERP